MRSRFFATLTLIVIFGLMGFSMARCSPGAASAAMVTELADAELSANGLGPLVVDVTTLGEVLRRYGHGSIAITGSDEGMAIELAWAGDGLVMMFAPEAGSAGSERLWQLGMRGTVEALRRSPDELSRSHPQLVGLTLQSVAVRRPWFTGQTDRGIAAGAPMSSVRSAHGPAQGMSPWIYAGVSSPHGRTRPIVVPGLIFHPDRDARSGSPLEDVATLVGEAPVVDWIVAFGE